jgi:hypothetical protein
MNMSDYKPKHFNWLAQNGVAVITLKGAERKNPITFESYASSGRPSARFRGLAISRSLSSAQMAAISAPAATFTTSSDRC